MGVEPDTLDPAGQTTTTIANMVDYWVLREQVGIDPRLAHWSVAPSPAGHEHATPKVREVGEAIGVAFDDLDLVRDPLCVGIGQP